MKEYLENRIENKEEPVVSVLSWLGNKEWEKNEEARVRLIWANDFVREMPRHQIGQSFDADFSSHFLKLYLESKEDNQLIKSKVENKVVIDLGTASSYTEQLNYFAEMKVKEFIGVEKYNIAMSSAEAKERCLEKGIQGDYIKSDMLLFLCKLPDKCANFVLNGIDENLITSGGYWSRIVNEITRTTYDKGIIMGCGSLFTNFKHEFSRLDTEKEGVAFPDECGIFEKK